VNEYSAAEDHGFRAGGNTSPGKLGAIQVVRRQLILINARCFAVPDHRTSNRLMERIMTTGNLLYLAMSIGMFATFSAVLAYQSWQQSKLGADKISAPAGMQEDPKRLAA
jgi:hypothetical protein